MHAGLELAQCMARFGSKVTVFAKSGEILGKEDRDAAAVLYKQLQADGVEFRMKARYCMIQSGGPEGQEIHVHLLGLHEGQAKVKLLLGHQVKAGLNNHNTLQAFQLIVLAGYLLGVPKPSPVSRHALTRDTKLHPRGVR